MTESVSPLREPRAPDRLRGSLPYAARPERSLRAIGPLRRTTTMSLAGVAFFIAAVYGARYGIGPAFFIMIAGLGYWTWTLRGFMRRQTQAAAALQAGDAPAAAAMLRRLACSRSAYRRAASSFALGVASLRAGDVETALQALQESWRGGALSSAAAATHEQLQPLIAVTYAVLGDVAAARAWSDDAERRAPVVTNQKHRAVANIFILARERRWMEARDRLEQEWLAIEETFNPELMRSMRVVRALVLASAGETARGRLIAAATKPLSPCELEWMGRHWPEMQAFIAENQLG